jgi:uncharacterized protein (DUF1697 family)
VRYVALLRTINAGAESRLSMGQLREALEAAGLTVLATYLQSGNVVLEAPRTSGAKLRQRIEAAVQAQLGRPTAAVVLTTKQLERVLASAPSGWADEDGFTHHLHLRPPAGYGSSSAARPAVRAGRRVRHRQHLGDLLGDP